MSMQVWTRFPGVEQLCRQIGGRRSVDLRLWKRRNVEDGICRSSEDEERLESNRNRRDGACARTCTNASHHIRCPRQEVGTGA